MKWLILIKNRPLPRSFTIRLSLTTTPERFISFTKKSRNRLPRSSKGSSSHTWLLLLGKFETLGSNFSYETAGLLASITTTLGSLFLRIHFYKNNLQIITQRCMWRHWEIHRQFLLMSYSIPSPRRMNPFMNHL